MTTSTAPWSGAHTRKFTHPAPHSAPMGIWRGAAARAKVAPPIRRRDSSGPGVRARGALVEVSFTAVRIPVQIEYRARRHVIQHPPALGGQRGPFVRELDQPLLFQVKTARAHQPILYGRAAGDCPQAFDVVGG